MTGLFGSPQAHRPSRAAQRAAGTVLLLSGVLCACGPGTAQTSPAGGSAASTSITSAASVAAGVNPFVVPAPAAAQREMCLDSTGSSNIAFAQSIRALVAADLPTVLPPRPATILSGAEPSAGLTLSIHLVTSAPFGFNQPHLHVEIPPVQGFAAQPDLHGPTAVAINGPYFKWKSAKASYLVQRGLAEKAVAAGAQQISAFPLVLPPGPAVHGSAIRACMSVLAVTLQPGKDTSIALASDLEDNAAPQNAGDFGGAPIHTIQPCASANGSRCAQLWTGFKAWLQSRHGNPLPPTVPEDSAAAIASWIQGQ